jgi:hypothetical protein
MDYFADVFIFAGLHNVNSPQDVGVHEIFGGKIRIRDRYEGGQVEHCVASFDHISYAERVPDITCDYFYVFEELARQ